MTPPDRYNICGDLGIHMVFLQSYIQGFGGQPHRELLALGKKLIDERVVKNINAPYISDLKVPPISSFGLSSFGLAKR